MWPADCRALNLSTQFWSYPRTDSGIGCRNPMWSVDGGGIIDLFGVLYCGSFGISRLSHDCRLRPHAVPAFSVDWFGDWPSRLDLVRLRGRGRFGGWLVMVRESRDSAVPDECGLWTHAGPPVSVDRFGNWTSESDSVRGEHWNQCVPACAAGW